MKINLKKSFNKYSFRSVLFKYMLIFFIIISLSFSAIISIFINMDFKNKSTEESLQFEKKIYICKSELDNIISSTYLSFYAVANDNSLNSILSEHTFNEPEYINAYNTLHDKFSLFSIRTNSLYTVYLYSPVNDYVYVLTPAETSSDYFPFFDDKYIFNGLMEDPSIESTIVYDENSSNISYVYKTSNANNDVGYFVYTINLSDISKSFDVPINLIDTNEKKVLFSSNKEITNDYEALYKLSENEEVVYPINNDNMILVFNPVYTNFSFSPMILIIIILFVLLISLILSYISATLIYYNIEKICNLVTSPFDSPIVNPREKNEFTYIVSEIHNLALQAQNFKLDLSDKAYLLKEAQANALQYQISPHFLLNTLNLINSIALKELKHDSAITDVINLLSKMLYTILNTTDNVICLADELNYIKDYINLQNLKYYNFDTMFSIPEELLDKHIVKFTLQPIIENAIHHGISSTENGKIDICSYIENDSIYKIEISNNGNIITPQKAEQVNNNILSEHQPHSSIGLWNTNRRLKLLFGEEYGIKIESMENLTKVTITLPL